MSDHSSNAEKTAPETSLESLRGKIDAIDNELLQRLEARQALSRQIATKKVLGSNVFRPDREVSLLRNLIASHPPIDPRLIMGLWRHIISASIAEQKPDYTIAHSHEAGQLADYHSAGYMQCLPKADVLSALACLKSKQADCVIITQDELAGIITELGETGTDGTGCFIAASIGFLQLPDAQRGYIICREMPADSGDDIIVIYGEDGSCHHLGKQDSDGTLPCGVIVGQYPRPLTIS